MKHFLFSRYMDCYFHPTNSTHEGKGRLLLYKKAERSQPSLLPIPTGKSNGKGAISI